MSDFVKAIETDKGDLKYDFQSLGNFPVMQVGQFLKVTAVDANGIPTAWEAASVPSSTDLEKKVGIGEYYDDMNALVASGVYRVGTNVNLDDRLWYGQVLVMQGATSDTVAQIGMDYTKSQLVCRSGQKVDGVWKFAPWAGFYSDANKPAADDLGVAPAVESADHPGCYSRTVDGETEWVNPPMVFGTEYRTGERYNGSPVYTKVVRLGYLPNNTSANIDIGVSCGDVISCEILVQNADANWPMPMSYNGAVSAFYYLTGTHVTLKTTRDYSSYYAVATIKYTK